MQPAKVEEGHRLLDSRDHPWLDLGEHHEASASRGTRFSRAPVLGSFGLSVLLLVGAGVNLKHSRSAFLPLHTASAVDIQQKEEDGELQHAIDDIIEDFGFETDQFSLSPACAWSFYVGYDYDRRAVISSSTLDSSRDNALDEIAEYVQSNQLTGFVLERQDSTDWVHIMGVAGPVAVDYLLPTGSKDIVFFLYTPWSCQHRQPAFILKPQVVEGWRPLVVYSQVTYVDPSTATLGDVVEVVETTMMATTPMPTTPMATTMTTTTTTNTVPTVQSFAWATSDGAGVPMLPQASAMTSVAPVAQPTTSSAVPSLTESTAMLTSILATAVPATTPVAVTTTMRATSTITDTDASAIAAFMWTVTSTVTSTTTSTFTQTTTSSVTSTSSRTITITSTVTSTITSTSTETTTSTVTVTSTSTSTNTKTSTSTLDIASLFAGIPGWAPKDTTTTKLTVAQLKEKFHWSSWGLPEGPAVPPPSLPFTVEGPTYQFPEATATTTTTEAYDVGGVLGWLVTPTQGPKVDSVDSIVFGK